MDEDMEIIESYQKKGHTFHCACRQVYGDGECECGMTDSIPGSISASMYAKVCPVCLRPNDKEHLDWCRNYTGKA